MGTFTTGATATNLGLTEGVILSTGSVLDAPGPNISGSTTSTNNTGSDPQLAALIPGYTVNDAAVLEFDFVPLSDTVKFRYVFGSEEYPEWVNSSFNDVFGFFISGPNPSGGNYANYNIAIIPGTTLPVTIDNVNATSYPQYYINNQNGFSIEYDGFTVVLTAWAKVYPCIPYHIKIAIGDAGDSAYDSAVFLAKNSFTSPTVSLETSYSQPVIDTVAVEGCNDAIVSFKLPYVSSSAWVVNYSIGGTAINGIDYTNIGTTVTIPAGQDSGAVVISPYLDGITEGTEEVILLVQTSPCGYDTLIIEIKDNTDVNALASPDTMICGGIATLSVTDPDTGGILPYQYDWSTGDTTQTIQVSPTVQTEYYATITDQCGNMDVDTVVVFIGGGNFASAGNDTIICLGDSVLLEASPACTDYIWSTGQTTQSIYVQPTVPTSYYVTMTQACTDSATVFVDIYALPNVTATVDPVDICRGETAVLSADGAETYEWIPDPLDASLVGQENAQYPVVSPDYSTTYILVGTDSNTCKNTAMVDLNIYPAPNAFFIASPSNATEFDPVIHFIDNSDGNPILWSWNMGDGTTYNVPNFYHTYSATGKYEVTLYIENIAGCSDTTKSFVQVRPDNTIYIPNAFTPNDDNLNDIFRVYGTNIIDFELMIYTRWGNLIFESDDINEGWNGTINGENAPVGLYHYKIRYVDSMGLTYNKYGHFTLVK